MSNSGGENVAIVHEAFARLERSSRALLDHLSQINEPVAGLDIASVQRFAEVAGRVCQSDFENLRENALSAYTLAARPNLEEADANYSHLLLDKLINDTRDALLGLEKAAGTLGLPAPVEQTPEPPQILIPAQIVALQVEELKKNVAEIQAEIGNIKIHGNQVGIINVSISQLDIKVDIVSALLAIKSAIDALSVKRSFEGMRVTASKTAGLVKDAVVGPIGEAISTSIKNISKWCSRSLSVVSSMILQHGSGGLDEDDIWSETEVQQMLTSGKDVPTKAVPFVRNLSFGWPQSPSISLIKKFTELRNLTVTVEDRGEYIPELANLRKLRNLTITISESADFTWLSELDKLENLRIEGSYRGVGVVVLPTDWESTKLESLTLIRCTVDQMPSLGGLPNLKTIFIQRVQSDDLSGLGAALSAQKVSLRGINMANLALLENMTELAELDIRESNIFNLEGVRNLRSLEKIWMSRALARRINLANVNPRAKIVGDHGGRIRWSRAR